MGNSEVGHLNIGAGRVVMQDLPRISGAFRSGQVADAPALRALIARLRQSGGTCHLMGLVSPGGVHSHQDHAAALAHLLADAGIPTLVHAFTDGRDTPPRSAGGDIARLSAALPRPVQIATVSGRYYAMDRDKRWDRVAKAYDALVAAEGPHFPDAGSVIADSYARDVSDEFVLPSVVADYRGMQDGDGVLCFNFRADRVREILAALLDPTFVGLSPQAYGPVCGRCWHDPIQRGARCIPRDDLSAASARQGAGPGGGGCRPHAAAHGGDREIPARHLFPERRRRGPVSWRGPHNGAVSEGCDLRSAAGDVGARADRQGRRCNRVRQIRSDRPQLRQPRHGGPHRQPARRHQGGRDRRCGARADRRRDCQGWRSSRSSLQITATAR